MRHFEFTKYVLHFSIFACFLLLPAGIIEAKGDVVDGSVRANYEVYEDGSLSYSLNFDIENSEPNKYITSFVFSIPFKEYSALNVTTNDLQNYQVIPGEYNSIQINFSRPLEYMSRNSVYVNLTVGALEVDVNGNHKTNIINPVTGQDVYYTISFPSTYGNANFSKSVGGNTIESQTKKITTFVSSEDMEVVWRLSNSYSFRLKYTLLGEENRDFLINLPSQLRGQAIKYKSLSGVVAGLRDKSGNTFGVAKSGEVVIEAEVDIQGAENPEIYGSKLINSNADSTFYKELSEVAESRDLVAIVEYLKTNLTLNRGFKISSERLWEMVDGSEAVNSFDAALVVSEVLNNAGIKTDVRYGYILEPFEINFPIAWIVSEIGEIDMFSKQFLNNDNPVKVVMGTITDNTDDLVLGVRADTPEVVRIEPIATTEVANAGDVTIVDTSSNLIQITNNTNSILSIRNVSLNGDINISVGGLDRVIIPGVNLIPITKSVGTLKVELDNGTILELNFDQDNVVASNNALAEILKPVLLISGGVIIFVLLFVVKRKRARELKFESVE